jgi:phosphate transport system substrate-binding protein
MKNNVVPKILLCVFLSAILLPIGFVTAMMTALMGGQKFYTPLVIIITISLIVFLILRVFEILNMKKLALIMSIFFGVCAIVSVGYEIIKSYNKSITIVNEQGVDLNMYKPFVNGTKAVKLNEASTFKITTELPRLDGATALYPLYSAFAQAVYPEKDYNIYSSAVMCNNTVGAYKNLIEGQADIIFAARPSQQQINEAKSKGLEFKLTPIGREAFVFFVNSKNNVNELSTKQIQDIYSGQATNWKELGGKNEKIRAFQRPENSGSQTMLQKIMEGKNLMTPPREDIASGMGDIISKTASYRNYKNAMGYSFLFFATEMVKNNQIRILKVDGIYPDRETIKSKTYPLSAEFYAVTVGSKNSNIEPFIQWILSNQGQDLVDKTGYTPVN